MSGRAKLRAFIGELLLKKDDTDNFADSDSLFASGRLDSLAAVDVVAFLEEEFAVDFQDTDFEIDRIDSIDAIVTLVGNAIA
jgi:acyl carrier protein